ncbi:MAG: hypothetical protein HY898_33960 [Deltaproteobacteria bacterium]|nr:hypothetical protein [Deltaproteobacteria bacterium]
MTLPKLLQRCSNQVLRAMVQLDGARRDLVRDRSGAVMSEYVILVGVVGLVIATAIVGIGPQLLASYERSRGILMSPLP